MIQDLLRCNNHILAKCMDHQQVHQLWARQTVCSIAASVPDYFNIQCDAANRQVIVNGVKRASLMAGVFHRPMWPALSRVWFFRSWLCPEIFWKGGCSDRGVCNFSTNKYACFDSENILVFSIAERHTKPSTGRPASEEITGCDYVPDGTIKKGSCDHTYYGVGVRDDVDHAISWCDKEQHVHLASSYVSQHLTVQVPTNSSTWADVVPHRVNVRGVSAVLFVYCGNGPAVLTKGKLMSRGGLINARNFSKNAHDTSPAFIMGMVISGFIIFYRLRRYFGCIESMAAVSYDHARRDETELLATNYVRLDSVA